MIKELEQFAKEHPDFDVEICDLEEDRQNSNWYDGWVFQYTYNKRFVITVTAVGDVTFTMKKEDGYFHSLEEADLKTDKDLRKIDVWLNNNWYELSIYDQEKDWDIYLAGEEVLGSVTDAIDLDFIKTLIDDYLKRLNKEEK